MEMDLEILLCFCDEAADVLNRWEQICFAFKKEGENPDSLQELFRLAHNLKGGSRAVGLLGLGDFIHKVEDGITLLRDGKIKLTPQLNDLLFESHSILNSWISGVKTNPEFTVDYADFLNKYTGVISGDVVSEVESQDSYPVVNENNHQPTAHKGKSKITKSEVNANETIRISAQRLDHLIQVIGELSIHQSIMAHTKNEHVGNSNIFNNSLHLSQKLTKELYDKALSLRMQPLQSVFQRLERNIVDLSKSLDKEVVVSVSGSEVELDKTVIEKIIDPLTHIVRNAIDHGVEGKADRLNKNKKAAGQIQISAHQDAFGVVITIKDDGKGLASDRILQKAKEKGLVDSNAKLSQDEIFQLIFLPGFSTAEKVTDVSGRGVGMDVVCKTLEKLNGAIHIESVLDQGTVFTITLPTSVSIVDSMIIRIAEQNYVVPVSSIEEVIHVDYDSLEHKNMYNLRNSVIPIHDLSLYLKNKNPNTKVNRNSLLVCKSGIDRIGFFVDKVVGQQQIVIRSLNENIEGAFGLIGGTILGNGEPGLIIDIPGLAQHFFKTHKPQEAAA